MDAWTKISLGRVPIEQVRNIARTIKMLWHNLEDVWPNGDRKQRPQMKFTKDKNEQCYLWLNPRALSLVMLNLAEVPDLLEKKDAGAEMPPNFLLPD